MTKRENARLAYEHKQPDYIPCLMTDISLFQACPQIEHYCGHETGKDYFGVEWTYEKNIHAPIPTPGKYLFEDIEDWKENMTIPDLEAIDWEKQADIDVHTDFGAYLMGEGLVPFKDGSSIYDQDTFKLCMVTIGMFERLHSCMGFENALMALASEPEVCSEFFGAIADYKIKYFHKIAQYYKIDCINAHDDYGTADRLFMSPETWRKIVKPHLARMVDACHKEGLIYQHHSCGYIEPIFDDFVEIGVDAIDPLQGCNRNLAELKKRYGNKITFCGGYDNQGILDIIGVSEDSIRAEYRRVADSLAPGGSFVSFPLTGTFNYVPTFLDEHFKYGMSLYKTK